MRTLVACVAALLVNATSASAAKLKVVTTISIIGDWVHNVGGDDIELSTLVGPDGDPHEYEPVPSDSLKVTQAAVIFENGLGLETWLPRLCDSSKTTAVRVNVTTGIEPRHETNHESDSDPHAWQDAANAIVCVGNIAKALVKADSAHAEGYKARALAYQTELQNLDRYMVGHIASIPPDRRKLVTSHDAFGYFAARYGFVISRNALASFTTDAADPSARQMAEAIDEIKASGVPVIFLENIENPRLIQRIASEAGVKVGPPLYSDALGPPGSSGDTYLKMMRYNTDTLVNALAP